MSKIIFNEHQIRQLELNPNVESVSDRSIQYTGDFKVRAVLENQEGKGPSQIFEEAGFDLTVIGRVKAKSALERWRKTYQTYGTEGLLTERRGNCLDNAPIESFFGHLKDHVEHRSALDLSEVRSMVDSYIDYYNSERKQWNLKKMTPEQYRSHLIAA